MALTIDSDILNYLLIKENLWLLKNEFINIKWLNELLYPIKIIKFWWSFFKLNYLLIKENLWLLKNEFIYIKCIND